MGEASDAGTRAGRQQGEPAADAAASPAPAPPPVVVVDVHEPLQVADLLRERAVVVERQKLAPADYVIGGMALERKTVGDFHQSLISKRLFEQLTRLKETYPAPVGLLLEGDLSAFESLKQPRAMWGALCSIAIDLDVVVLPTASPVGTADLLATLARRAARMGVTRGEVRFKPRMLSPQAEQKFAVQGLPGIGDVVSENLLEHFGSVRRVYAASERELLRAPGIGRGRARDIAEFLDRPFEGRQGRLRSAE